MARALASLVAWCIAAVMILSLPQLSIHAKLIGIQIAAVLLLLVSQPESRWNRLVRLVLSSVAVSVFVIECLRFLQASLELKVLPQLILLLPSSVAVMLGLGSPILLVYVLRRGIHSRTVGIVELVLILYISSLAIAALLGIAYALSLLDRALMALYTYLSLIPLLALLILTIKPRELGKTLKRAWPAPLVLLPILSIVFYCYPETTLTWTDPSRHYASAIGFLANPSSIFLSPYPGYIAHLALLHLASGSPLFTVLNTGLAFWAPLLLLAFYLLARKLLGPHGGWIAVLLLALFSGLGWICLLSQILSGSIWWKRLWKASALTNMDIGHPLGLWLWYEYRPLTVGLTCLFTLAAAAIDDKEWVLPRRLLYALTMFVISLYHPSELALAVLFLLPLSTIHQPRWSDLASMALGVVLSIPVAYIYSSYMFTGKILFMALIAASILLIRPLTHLAKWVASKLPQPHSLWPHLPGLLLVFYVLAAYEGIEHANKLVPFTSFQLLVVPLYQYPVLLGAVGGLALVLVYLEPCSAWLRLLLFYSALGATFGKFLSYTAEYMPSLYILIGARYFERRILASILYPVACIMTSKLLMKLREMRTKRRYNLYQAALLILLLTLSLPSTLYTLDYKKMASRVWAIKLEDVSKLARVYANTSLLEELSTGILLPSGEYLWGLSQFLPALWRVNPYHLPIIKVDHVLPLLLACSAHNAACTLFAGKDGVHGGLSTLEHIAANIASLGNYSLEKLPPLTPPKPKTALVGIVFRELNKQIDWLTTAASILGLNYTLTYYLDMDTLASHKILVAPNTETYTYITKLTRNYSRWKPKSIIVFNFNGNYQPLANLSELETRVCINADRPVIVDVKGAGTRHTTVNRAWCTMLPLASLTLGTTVTGDDEEALVLLDEEPEEVSISIQGVGWKGRRGVGEPNATLAPGGVSGTHALQIRAREGPYLQWELRIKPEKPLNATGYSYLTLYWHGRGDDGAYTVQVYTSGGSIWYRFHDTWNGWKKILLPLHTPDGKYNIQDVKVEKKTLGTPHLDQVKLVVIRSATDNPNPRGVFMIDRIALEHTPRLHVTIVATRSLAGYNIELVYPNKTSLEAWLEPGNTTRLDCLKATMREDGELELELEALDPHCLAVTIKLTPYEIIEYRNHTIQLPASPHPAEKSRVIAWIGETPLVVLASSSPRVYYVNIYPFYKALTEKQISTRDLLHVILHALDTIPETNTSQEKKLTPINTFLKTYRVGIANLEAEGNITLHPLSGSIILQPADGNCTLILPEGTELHATRLRVASRLGYYIKLVLYNMTATKTAAITIVCGDSIVIANTTSEVIAKATVLLRGLTVDVEGKTKLHRACTWGLLYTRYKLQGASPEVIGRLHIELEVFDNTMLGPTLNIEGRVSPDYVAATTLNLDLEALTRLGLPVLILYMLTLLHRARDNNARPTSTVSQQEHKK